MSQVPRPEHPRPDFERNSWQSLNGVWDFAYDDADCGLAEKWFQEGRFPMRITVPFCYQSRLSGIGDQARHDVVWYRRGVAMPESFAGKRVLLHFGAVDHTADVWINGQHVGCHIGGFTSFSFDITDHLSEKENLVVVRAFDELEAPDHLRGKQRWLDHNFGCWYTPVTGIWQSVWLEAVPALHLTKVKMTPDVDAGMLRCEAYFSKRPSGETLSMEVSFAGAPIAKASLAAFERVVRFDIDLSTRAAEWQTHLWEPNHPNLYDVVFTLEEDTVRSYFGLRKVGAREGKILLNDRPIYQRLVLNQGYYEGGLLTAGSDADFVKDLELMKQLGFNGLRVHQKVEDPRFLYWCDKLGLLVWAEMGSPYLFNDIMMAENTRQWQEAIERDYNHPSIIVWTLMNESWGIPKVLSDVRQQAHSLALYHQAKACDPTRLAISNDGWEHTQSDIVTFHDYNQDAKQLAARIADSQSVLRDPIASVGDSLGHKFAFANGFHYQGQPILFSECCGTAFAGAQGWGYGEGVCDDKAYLQRYRELIGAIYDTEYLCGFCVTQFTDVEQEVNGILTIDRKPKAEMAAFARIVQGKEGLLR